MPSHEESLAELEARERRTTRWSWVVVAILFGVPALALIVSRVYIWVVVDTTGGWSVQQSLLWSMASVPAAVVLALVWTWWEGR